MTTQPAARPVQRSGRPHDQGRHEPEAGWDDRPVQCAAGSAAGGGSGVRAARPCGGPVAVLAAAVVVLIVSATISGTSALNVVDRLRSDTPVTAVTVGEPGCVTDARFTDGAGTSHLVSLRVYKGNCLDRDPGEAVTVFYDADDPETSASSRAWWWPSLLVLVGPAGVALAVRALLRGPRAPAPPTPQPVPAARSPRRRERAPRALGAADLPGLLGPGRPGERPRCPGTRTVRDASACRRPSCSTRGATGTASRAWSSSLDWTGGTHSSPPASSTTTGPGG